MQSENRYIDYEKLPRLSGLNLDFKKGFVFEVIEQDASLEEKVFYIAEQILKKSFHCGTILGPGTDERTKSLALLEAIKYTACGLEYIAERIHGRGCGGKEELSCLSLNFALERINVFFVEEVAKWTVCPFTFRPDKYYAVLSQLMTISYELAKVDQFINEYSYLNRPHLIETIAAKRVFDKASKRLHQLALCLQFGFDSFMTAQRDKVNPQF